MGKSGQRLEATTSKDRGTGIKFEEYESYAIGVFDCKMRVDPKTSFIPPNNEFYEIPNG